MKEKKVTVISLAEVKAILSKLDLEEADQIQKRTLDYVKGFPDSNPKKIDSAAEKIAELGSISLEDAYEILNICPKTIPELRVFTSLSLIHISEPTRPERIGGGGVGV